MWITTVIVISLMFTMGTSQECSQSVSSRCGTGYRQGITAAQRDELLKAHNTLRSFVAQGKEKRGSPGPQPAASNMQQMVWDSEMARLAQNWANQCTFAHNKCGGSPNRFFDIGQNVYLSPYNEPNMTQAVESWYTEVQYFDRASINPFVYMKKTGHYTQVAWAESRYLGCGHMSYKDGNRNQHLLVCDYGPSGNLPGSTMYNTTGKPCSTCPSKKCSANYAALCA